jgi:hypothetical protein
VHRLGVDEADGRASEHASAAHGPVTSDRLLGGGEGLRGAALGEAELRQRPEEGRALEGGHQPERDLELALGCFEIALAAEKSPLQQRSGLHRVMCKPTHPLGSWVLLCESTVYESF